MRLTTKIIIGFILSVFLISLMFIIGFSFTDRKNYQGISNVNTINLPQDNKTSINVALKHTIVFECEEFNAENEYSYAFANNECGLYLSPATTKEEENKLFVPEVLSDFITTNTQDDTLFVRVKINELVKKYEKDKKHTFFSGVNFNLYTNNVHIINKLGGVPTEIRRIETDSITIISYENILIESCKADVVEPIIRNGHRKLTINNSNIRKLYLDLDYGYHRYIERSNNNITEEYISGSQRHDFTYGLNNSDKIIWQPKNKDAKLNITLQGDTTQIILQ